MIGISTTQLDSYRKQKKIIVFSNGCFDLLHRGHVSSLQFSRKQGDVLIVAINSDLSVKKLKGSSRPFVGLDERMFMVDALECVDHVVSFSNDFPEACLRLIQPKVAIKGGIDNHKRMVRLLNEWGGVLVRAPSHFQTSTTNRARSVFHLLRADPSSRL